MTRLNVFGDCKGLNKDFLEEVLDKVHKSLKIEKESPVNLIFASKDKIQGLNSKYRGKNEPTDVLSFNYSENDCKGEVVVYLDRIRRDSKTDGIGFKEGFTKVFIHGILHLYGYDHHSKKDEVLMKKKESEIFQLIV